MVQCLANLCCSKNTAQDQAVAAVNMGEQGPSSVSESVSYPDATTIQHIVSDAVSSGGENGKRSRKPRISETIILNDCLCAIITLLFSLFRMKTFTAACHYSFKKCRLIIQMSLHSSQSLFDNLCRSHLQSSDSFSQFKNPGERFDWSIDRVAVG